MPAESTKSPTSAASPASDVDPANKSRPPPRPNRSNFDLEPNPFEQSFARPSNDSSVRTQQNSPSAVAESNDGRTQSRPGSADKTSSTTTPPDKNNKTVLPPLAAIASPSDAHYSWAFSSSSFSNSLRSGPLSPAMLTGPQQQSEQQPLAAFDPAAFRTGLTPRMGLTPGTGLTPLLGGPVSFPPASPNTAAFLSSVMNNGGTPSLSGVAGTITPNTLSAITGVLSNQSHGHAQSPLSMSTVTSGYPPRSDANATNGNAAATNGASASGANGTYPASANNAAQTATNGLFLLSQAHQELTKREEEAAAALTGSANTNGAAKRGTKRKSYEVESPVIAAPPPVAQQAPANGKRTRSQTTSSNDRRASTVSLGDEEEEEEDDDDMTKVASSTGSQSQKKGGQKKPETEEEKRRNFLERNRQGEYKMDRVITHIIMLIYL